MQQARIHSPESHKQPLVPELRKVKPCQGMPQPRFLRMLEIFRYHCEACRCRGVENNVTHSGGAGVHKATMDRSPWTVARRLVETP